MALSWRYGFMSVIVVNIWRFESEFVEDADIHTFLITPVVDVIKTSAFILLPGAGTVDPLKLTIAVFEFMILFIYSRIKSDSI